MVIKSKIAFSLKLLCIFCMVMVSSAAVFAQKIDTTKLSIKPKAKVVSKVPQLRANIPTYRPSSLGYTPSNTAALPPSTKQIKVLSVLKVYPNPVSDQININLRLEKEISLSVKITDLLGNDVVTLANEKCQAGEQTKTYTIPNRLNAGMYFLKIVGGGELVMKRISVL